MAGNLTRRDRRIGNTQCPDQVWQHGVLPIIVRCFVLPFEFNTHREVIAPMLPAEAGFARVPCAFTKRHKLDDAPVAPNENMRGYLHAPDFSKVRVRTPVQRIGEQRFDFRPAKFARRETDPVNDNHGWPGPIGTIVLVRAMALHGRLQQTSGFVDVEEA